MNVTTLGTNLAEIGDKLKADKDANSQRKTAMLNAIDAQIDGADSLKKSLQGMRVIVEAQFDDAEKNIADILGQQAA